MNSSFKMIEIKKSFLFALYLLMSMVNNGNALSLSFPAGTQPLGLTVHAKTGRVYIAGKVCVNFVSINYNPVPLVLVRLII